MHDTRPRGSPLPAFALAVAITVVVAGCGAGDGTAPGTGESSAGPVDKSTIASARRALRPGGGNGGGGTGAGVLRDVPTTRQDAARFLHQASFGPNETTLAEVMAKGPHKALVEQFAQPVSRYAYTQPANAFRDQIHVYVGDFCAQFAAGTPENQNCWRDWYTTLPLQWDFFRQAVSAPDQLRQRVAFALGQIFVTSHVEVSGAYGFAEYHQMLRDNAFGNFRTLLEKVTLSPLMGDYLDMVNNDGAAPNENYARELLQLFSLGTCRLNADGSLETGRCVATYDNAIVREYAYALSGWTYPPGGKLSWCNPLCSGWQNPRYYRGAMVPVAARHDKLQRTLLSGVVAPAGRTPAQGLAAVLDSIMAHPNLAPFIGRRLIKFLVTSNPSPAYVSRVAAAFVAGRYSGAQGSIGSGAKGDLQAVLAAILLDAEARDAGAASASAYGKLREPAVFMAGAIRALDGVTDGERLGLWGWGTTMNQPVFNAPSVFNFFSPDFPLTGTVLTGPEFGILSTNTAFARINFVNDLVYWWYGKGQGLAPNASIPGATGTRVSYARWESLVAKDGDAIKVVDRLNDLLVAGRLTAAEKQAITAAMAEWKSTDTWLTDANNASSWQREQVKTAAYLILASPQYQVQR
ncbi:MAG: DUF1800 domain-containing protein [Burkholderiaceae bacterium]